MSEPSSAPEYDGQQVVWVGGDDPYHVSILEQDTLYLADNLKKKAMKKGLAALEEGTPPAEAFSKINTIPVATISQINTADHLTAVKFRYEVDGREKKDMVMADDDDERMAAFDTLHAAMGPQLECINQPLPLGQAVIGPSVALLATLGGTAVMYMAAGDIDPNEEYNPVGRRAGIKKLTHWLLETLGPSGVLVVGGLAVAASAFWMYRRISSPPQEFTVSRG